MDAYPVFRQAISDFLSAIVQYRDVRLTLFTDGISPDLKKERSKTIGTITRALNLAKKAIRASDTCIDGEVQKTLAPLIREAKATRKTIRGKAWKWNELPEDPEKRRRVRRRYIEEGEIFGYKAKKLEQLKQYSSQIRIEKEKEEAHKKEKIKPTTPEEPSGKGERGYSKQLKKVLNDLEMFIGHLLDLEYAESFALGEMKGHSFYGRLFSFPPVKEVRLKRLKNWVRQVENHIAGALLRIRRKYLLTSTILRKQLRQARQNEHREKDLADKAYHAYRSVMEEAKKKTLKIDWREHRIRQHIYKGHKNILRAFIDMLQEMYQDAARNKIKCGEKTLDGTPCENDILPDEPGCYQHWDAD